MKYGEYWAEAVGEEENVGGKEAVAFLGRAKKVSKGQLRRIWDIADHQKEGFLARDEFYIALRLVALAQRGAELSVSGLRNFTGIQLIPDIAPAEKKEEPRVEAPKQADGFSWTVTKEVASKYDDLFRKLDTKNMGMIDGKQGVTFFGKSGLPRPTLKKIWDLADVTKDGMLSLDEFRCAMHMVSNMLSRKLTVTALPSVLDSSGPNWFRVEGEEEQGDGLFDQLPTQPPSNTPPPPPPEPAIDQAQSSAPIIIAPPPPPSQPSPKQVSPGQAPLQMPPPPNMQPQTDFPQQPSAQAIETEKMREQLRKERLEMDRARREMEEMKAQMEKLRLEKESLVSAQKKQQEPTQPAPYVPAPVAPASSLPTQSVPAPSMRANASQFSEGPGNSGGFGSFENPMQGMGASAMGVFGAVAAGSMGAAGTSNWGNAAPTSASPPPASKSKPIQLGAPDQGPPTSSKETGGLPSEPANFGGDDDDIWDQPSPKASALPGPDSNASKLNPASVSRDSVSSDEDDDDFWGGLGKKPTLGPAGGQRPGDAKGGTGAGLDDWMF